MDFPRSRGHDVAARRDPGCLGVGLARGWSRPSRVRPWRQPVRRRSAPRDRHRSGRRRCGPCACVRRRDLCGAGSDARTHGHHHDGRRSQGIANPPRAASREARKARDRGGADRRPGTIRRARALRPVRPPRDSRRGGGDVRGPTFAAPAAGCPIPSAGTRGAARTCSGARSGAAFDVAGTAGRVASAGTHSRTATGSLLCSGREHTFVCARGEGPSSAGGGGRRGAREPGRIGDDRPRCTSDRRVSGAGECRATGLLLGPVLGPAAVGRREREDASVYIGIRLACSCPVGGYAPDRCCDGARTRARLPGGSGCRTLGQPPP